VGTNDALFVLFVLNDADDRKEEGNAVRCLHPFEMLVVDFRVIGMLFQWVVTDCNRRSQAMHADNSAMGSTAGYAI
jgi:hypothetical protein